MVFLYSSSLRLASLRSASAFPSRSEIDRICVLIKFILQCGISGKVELDGSLGNPLFKCLVKDL